MTMLDTKPDRATPTRRPGELTPRELGRFAWRQLTSMRTALILLLLLALAAVPGSVIPQERADSLDATRFRDAHPTLAPVYDRLGLFHVYTSVWFAAIYLLLVVSLIGCILPRTMVYARAMRAQPPAAPRHLTRLPDHASYTTTEAPEVVLERARAVLGRRHRLRAGDAGPSGDAGADSVSAERGYLREAGNLLFHLSVLVVLVGFALGGLFGYRGGVILVQGIPFSNNLTQYDDVDPGSLFDVDAMPAFDLTMDRFDVDWLPSGQARGFNAHLDYTVGSSGADRTYDLRVNHPLGIEGTEVFLIGHGYAPVVTVRDAAGQVGWTGPVVFLPQGPDFFSVGVVKAANIEPQLGLEGFLYPDYARVGASRLNLGGDDRNPVISMRVFSGDLGLDDGDSQSVYVLDKAGLSPVTGDDGQQVTLDLGVGDSATLPNGDTVTFDGMRPWTRLQLSHTPGTKIALAGVVLALVGLLGSLFIRPRRLWVRARRDEHGRTLVEVAALDRSAGGDPAAVLSKLTAALQPASPSPRRPE